MILSNHQHDPFEIAARRLCYSKGSRFRAKGEFLFAGVPLAGAHVLEVGCGNGTWAIWAALHNADRVVGIDPEAHGSSSGDFASFQETIEILGLTKRVAAYERYLHQLPEQDSPFNVVVMYDVINHLDELAVSLLHRDQDASKSYVRALQSLRSHMRGGGWAIVADCARDNFWPQIGLKSPFTHNQIEWQKHQNPDVWIGIFKQAGFRLYDLRWSPLYPFRTLTSNRLVQFLTYSHFVLRLRAD